ncbi:hypothetical protein MTX78_25140 (plasmid) [Hymenobacter tibetensis]|uniref:Uncharacterized protein n=1 Tax=Hymenobacter tibetensis TaxID=497967 RepID=A0ABY4D5C4_9BACT|nr:hypothetical protein [Hymenobacter tibetensis]UOG77695.1 hypothetical protein MTX78_25140 [Hymenobacter tibetensis]
MNDIFETPEDSQDRKRKAFQKELEDLQEAERRMEKEFQTRIEFPKKTSDSLEDDFISSEEESMIDSSENPGLVEKMWHEAQNVIIKRVKKGHIRTSILLEKKTYLKAASNTRDSKFSFKDATKQIFDIVDDWAATEGEGIELAISLWELNESAGFHKSKKARPKKV